MKVAKWGNSLAIRIPAEAAEALGLKEGDDVELRPNPVSGLELLREPTRRDKINRLREILKGRIPEDYKFDREEANARRP